MKPDARPAPFAAFNHPLTWAMIALLAFNDLVLKPLAPSWWSGKLSDLALLYLLPLVCAGTVSLFSRARRWPLYTAFILPALVFALGKTIAPLNLALYHFLDRLLPFPVHFVYDPGDLLALAALPLAWWVWRRTQTAQPRAARWQWLALPLALSLTLADAAAPEYGVVCLDARDDGTLLALTYYQGDIYQSRDGGASWQPAPADEEMRTECSLDARQPGESFIFIGADEQRWRFTVGEKIEYSPDGGQTWQTELTLQRMSQAEEAYRQHQQSTFSFVPGPLDLLHDPQTGTLIAAMGQEGILRRTADGEWQRVAVGDYSPQAELASRGAAGLFSLLWAEWITALFGAVFLVSLFNLQQHRRWWRVVKVVLAFLGWTLILLFSPALADSYIYPLLVTIAIPAAGFWALLSLADDIYTWVRQPTRLWRVMVSLGLLAAVAMIFLYTLWGLAWIPRYETALLLGLVVFLLTAAAGWYWLRSRRHQEEKI